jgi:hypothetical protein
MTTTVSFAALTIDSGDPAGLAGFWGQALGRPVSPGAIAGDTAIDQTGPEGGPRIILHRPEGQADKNAIHPVLMTDRYGEEIERLTALGARVVRELSVPAGALPPDTAEVRQATLADPDGNEFELVLWRQAA